MKAFLLKLILAVLLCLGVFSAPANAQCTLTTSANASSLACGVAPLNACNGILYVGDGVTAMTITMDSALNLTCLGTIQMIVRNNATLFFTPGNDHLTLAAGSSITFEPGAGLTGGSCNASERIYIGTNLLASCNGGAGADVNFATLLTLGGTGSLASNSPVCLGDTINLTATPPPNGTYTYSWSGPGLPTTAFLASPNYSVTSVGSGTYQVRMKSSLLPGNPAVAEAYVTVVPLPTPTIDAITQPDCSVFTGSVDIGNLPDSGTWTLTMGGAASGTTTGTGTTTTISGLALGTYTFKVTVAPCSSLNATVTITPVSSSTWNGTAWSNGIPTPTTNVVFKGNYSLNADVEGCSCQVVSGNVVIRSGHVLNLDKAVAVLGGSLTISDNASLVQADDSAVNNGNIIVKRAATLRRFDYVYWSSPVDNFPLTGISPTTMTDHQWKWIPTVGGNYGIWTNTTENMISGKGYIVRGPMTFDNITAQKYTATFTGVPHNGVVTPTIERGSYQGADYPASNGSLVTNRDDNYNLVGNPYPSSIKALDFLTLNTELEGAIRIWTHGTLPNTSAPNPFYGSFLYNYSIEDYIVYNGTGTISGPAGFNGYVGSGQAFFVAMVDGDATTSVATFNNSMRRSTYDNSQFYRYNDRSLQTEGDPGRIWLDLVASGGTVSRTLVGYTAGATLNKDRLYDATIKMGNVQNFYSLIREQKMCIQGRPLPFEENDVVALGYQSAGAGTFSVAIAAVDGLFDGNAKPIYLKDQLLNIVHNLRESPYQFTTAAGTFDDRFILFYSNAVAGNKVLASGNQGSVAVTQQDGQISIESFGSGINTVRGYDLTGRMLFDKERVNESRLEITGLAVRQQVLVIQIRLNDGNTVTKKVNH